MTCSYLSPHSRPGSLLGATLRPKRVRRRLAHSAVSTVMGEAFGRGRGRRQADAPRPNSVGGGIIRVFNPPSVAARTERVLRPVDGTISVARITRQSGVRPRRDQQHVTP